MAFYKMNYFNVVSKNGEIVTIKNVIFAPEMTTQKKVTPYKDSSLNKKEQVEQMFDTISNKYDNLNRVISLGTDLKWRRKVLKMVKNHTPDSILDVATGTGDLAIQFAKNIAQKKVANTPLDEKVDFIKGDGEAMPFKDNSFDVVTVSFGVRNFENLEKGLSEILRVLKKGGLFIILETSVPEKFPFKQGYHIYSKNILPLVGTLFSKDKVAYNYLSESASVFPYAEALNNILRKTGFIEVQHKPQTFGVATIYSATK